MHFFICVWISYTIKPVDRVQSVFYRVSFYAVKIAFDAKQFGVREWWQTLALAFLTGLAGMLLAFRPSEAVSVIMTLFGISLLTEGVLNLSVAVSLV